MAHFFPPTFGHNVVISWRQRRHLPHLNLLEKKNKISKRISFTAGNTSKLILGFQFFRFFIRRKLHSDGYRSIKTLSWWCKLSNYPCPKTTFDKVVDSSLSPAVLSQLIQLFHDYADERLLDSRWLVALLGSILSPNVRWNRFFFSGYFKGQVPWADCQRRGGFGGWTYSICEISNSNSLNVKWGHYHNEIFSRCGEWNLPRDTIKSQCVSVYVCVCMGVIHGVDRETFYVLSPYFYTY